PPEPASPSPIESASAVRVPRRRPARPRARPRRPAHGTPPRHGRITRAQARAAARHAGRHRRRASRHHLPRGAGSGPVELTATDPLVVAVVISRNEEPWIESTLPAA